MPRVYRSSGYPCGRDGCNAVLPTAGALGGHRAQHKRADEAAQETRPQALLGVVAPVCSGCGGSFGAPADRTDTEDGRALCRPCADAEGLVSQW